jgi:biopolymer transport protein ExbD
MKLTQRGGAPTSSMADIAFLLIIFFMVTAVFAMTKGLEFKLPQQEEQSAAEEEEAVFIQVFPDETIAVDCQPMEHSRILEYLYPKLSRNPEKPVIIYSDPDAAYQGMIAVYDVLVQAEEQWKAEGMKVKNISIPTQTDVRDYTALFGQNPFLARCQ